MLQWIIFCFKLIIVLVVRIFPNVDRTPQLVACRPVVDYATLRAID